jgi:2-desacetyl-2-hydroxyethyl bacteriochlorophyllide A dehydrogenase
MRAVVLQGPEDVRVEQVDDPVLPGPDGAVVRVERAAICGSDLHLYHGKLGEPGVCLGHEFIGEVVEVGADVRGSRVGDRVLVSGITACGRCPGCRAGNPVLCVSGPRVFGTDLTLPGGQAEAVAVPSADFCMLTVPDGVTTEQAVLLTDILPTGYLGAQRAGIRPGDTVAVIGQGPVGTLALQCALLHGAARVIAIDRVPERLANASRLGATTVDASNGDAVAQVLELTGGRGANAVIEAVGSDPTVTDALMMCAPEGTVSVIGVNLRMDFPFPLALALLRNLTFRVTFATIPATWAALVPLLQAGRLEPDDVFTHRLPLSEAAHAYDVFANRRDGCLKVLLDPTA